MKKTKGVREAYYLFLVQDILRARGDHLGGQVHVRHPGGAGDPPHGQLQEHNALRSHKHIIVSTV